MLRDLRMGKPIDEGERNAASLLIVEQAEAALQRASFALDSEAVDDIRLLRLIAQARIVG